MTNGLRTKDWPPPPSNFCFSIPSLFKNQTIRVSLCRSNRKWITNESKISGFAGEKFREHKQNLWKKVKICDYEI